MMIVVNTGECIFCTILFGFGESPCLVQQTLCDISHAISTGKGKVFQQNWWDQVRILKKYSNTKSSTRLSCHSQISDYSPVLIKKEVEENRSCRLRVSVQKPAVERGGGGPESIWMVYRGPGFLSLASCLSFSFSLSYSLSLCPQRSLLARGEEAQSYDSEKARSLQIVQYSLGQAE